MSNLIAIFANPIAGRGRGRALATEVAKELAAKNFDSRIYLDLIDTLDPSNLRDLSSARAIVVIGGDGTLRAVAGRLVELLDPVPPIAVVPLGTANLMGQHLSIARAASPVEMILASHMIEVDLVSANEHLLLLMASVGVDASVVHEVARARRGPIRKLSYILPSLLAAFRYEYPAVTVEVDQAALVRSTRGIAWVANIAEYGIGFPLLPGAKSADGLLDICFLPCDSSITASRMLLHAAAGEHLSAEGAIYAQGSQVRITSARDVPVQVDGEAFGHTPVDIALLPKRLRFIVPVA